MKKNIPLILFSLIVTFGASALVAHAQGYTPLAPLPGTVNLDDTTALRVGETNLTTYISGAIKLLIAIGGALSILMAIIGGAQFVTAGIAPSARQDAKNRILNAFTGLALILSSYLILNSINPKLVEFKLSLENVTPVITRPVTPETVQTTVTALCNPTMTPLDTDAQIMENYATINPSAPEPVWTSTDPDIHTNLNKLQAQVTLLQTKLTSVGASATVNSAYRPLSYQKHLFEVFKAWAAFYNATNDPTIPQNTCPQMKKDIEAEHTKHGLGTAVSTPTICAPHVRGTGVDLKITGFTGDINQLMSVNNIDLKWQGIYGDEVHFNLQNPPYTPPGCN